MELTDDEAKNLIAAVHVAAAKRMNRGKTPGSASISDSAVDERLYDVMRQILNEAQKMTKQNKAGGEHVEELSANSVEVLAGVVAVKTVMGVQVTGEERTALGSAALVQLGVSEAGSGRERAGEAEDKGKFVSKQFVPFGFISRTTHCTREPRLVPCTGMQFLLYVHVVVTVVWGWLEG